MTPKPENYRELALFLAHDSTDGFRKVDPRRAMVFALIYIGDQLKQANERPST